MNPRKLARGIDTGNTFLWFHIQTGNLEYGYRSESDVLQIDFEHYYALSCVPLTVDGQEKRDEEVKNTENVLPGCIAHLIVLVFPYSLIRKIFLD
ncbi:hypothetical protein [Nostoc flagelliforme]|uniref:hypothetical protein n=1 Tax=Nostoc flagelliforme TaxID=1306274 RepID=UPI0012FD6488